MFKIIHEDINPKVIVVTPLLSNDKISKKTKNSIKRNTTPYIWCSYSSNNNIPMNVSNCLEHSLLYLKKYSILPLYVLPLDNDIILGRNMIDKMYKVLSNSVDNIAFTYASFKFQGAINVEFPAIPYNINRLLQSNYISSNSMIKIDKLKEVGGFVTDNKYKRLLDYCLWLKMFFNGYIGIPSSATFIAIAEEGSISTGNNEDYQIKYKRVYNDFINPILNKYNS